MADNKKEKIYDAVLQLFKEGKAIKNIKVSEIADRAGIGKGTIYLQFASKDDVIVEAAKYFFDTWLAPFRGFVIDKEKDFKDVVMEFIDIHLEFLDEYANLFNPQGGSDYSNVFNSNTLSGTIEIARNARLEYIDAVERVLSAGVNRKLISYINRYSTNVVAESIMLMIKYIGLGEVLHEEITYSVDECKELIYDMILRVCK